MSSESTSTDSYRQALVDGLISQRHYEVLAFVAAHDSPHGVSQGEVSRHFNDASSSYQPRFRELQDAGVLYQCGHKKDAITSRTVKSYRLTKKMPESPVMSGRKHRVNLPKALVQEVIRLIQKHRAIPDDAEVIVRAA